MRKLLGQSILPRDASAAGATVSYALLGRVAPSVRIEQVYSTGALSQSTGLGLTLARRFVVAKVRGIAVRSNEGPGTTFTVRIPRGPVP